MRLEIFLKKFDARNRFNETLILLGKDTLSDSEKFLGFEKIHLKDADWKFKDLNIEAKNELLVENSNLTLDGGVISTTILNNENDSNLKVSKETTINGNLINKGNIIFENNPINYSILNINGDYSGENGKILLRVKVEDSPKLTDKLIINGNASGNTNIEISNPGSTLAQKMKEKVKIIETNTSEYDTFTLLNPEHSNYIYKLFSKEEGNKKNWYLIQEFAGPTDDFGLIINSMYLGQQHFNFNFLEHSKYIIEKNNNFWIKTSNMNNYNKLSNRKDISIPIKSNTTTTIMGYDLLKNSKNDEEKKLGIFGNLGVNSSKSMESEISSISGILGAGIYGTWKKKDFYVDGWINYTYLQNRINIETPINYGLHSLRTSTEFGINGDMNIGNLGRLHANHHLQLTYSYVTNPKIKVLEGEEIEYIGNHNLTSKLGTNLIFYTKNKYLKPFIEFNWSYGINLVGLKLGEDKYYYDGNKDVMEIKWGLKEIEINDNLTLWGNILHQFTEKKYRTHGVELGLLYKF
ncbi:autotransporter outer membrane beta-barrel domain-containing protein [Streptobacillus canis]|uniref:autotransporter outer membrane beta-barrel domain-containing protein n=1 Tax=Streptobacillus canis TaxID=2678686 RepID=UPI0012E23993|nr:autotransporter outer membrane beta-barrel domain-containing protein [Streptobacillus canis]